MSISYLSKPLQSEVRPFQENIDLISRVSAYKQSRYDQVVDTMLQKQNDLLNIDLTFAPIEARTEKENLLKRADEQLNQLAKVDLLNPENINKAEAIFEPIVNNEKIILGAQFTKQVRENQEVYDELRKKKPELYNSANEAYTMQQAMKAKNMSFKDFKENYQNFDIQAIQFRDIPKEFREAAKTLGLTYKGYTQMKDGMYILTEERGYLKAENILDVFPNDAGILAQAKVNAWSSMGNVTKEDILSSQLKINEDKVNETIKANEDFKYEYDAIQNNIKLLESNDPTAKAKLTLLYGDKIRGMDFSNAEHREALANSLKKEAESISKSIEINEKQISDYNEEGNELKSYFSTDLSEQQLLGLKTNLYLQNLRMGVANAFARDERSIKIDVDKEAEMQIKFENDLALKNADAQIDLQKKLFEKQFGLDGGGSGSGSGSPKTPDNNFTPLQPAESQDKGSKEEITRKKMIDEQIVLQNDLGGKFVDVNGKKVFEVSKYGEETSSFNQLLKNKVPINYFDNPNSYPEKQQIEKEIKSQIDTYQSIIQKRTDPNNKTFTGNQTFEDALAAIPQDIRDYVDQRSLKVATLQENVKLLNSTTEIAKNSVKLPNQVNSLRFPVNDYFLGENQITGNNVIIEPFSNGEGGVTINNLKLDDKFTSILLNRNLNKSETIELLKSNGFYTNDQNLSNYQVNNISEYLKKELKISDYKEKVAKTTNSILKEYSTSNMTAPLYATNLATNSPQYQFVEATKQYIKASKEGSFEKEIEIKSYVPLEEGGYKVVYNLKGEAMETDREAILKNEFISQWGQFLKTTPNVQLWNQIQTQAEYAMSGATYATNKLILSNPFNFNGRKFQIGFDPKTMTDSKKLLLFMNNNSKTTNITEGLPVNLEEALAIMNGRDLISQTMVDPTKFQEALNNTFPIKK